jgi:hypothetical protein
MGLVARLGAFVVVSAAGFALAWWVCGKLLRLDEGWSLGIAGAVVTIVATVAGWWAAQGSDSGGSDGTVWQVVQKARGRNVNMAGRDQTVINYRHRDE